MALLPARKWRSVILSPFLLAVPLAVILILIVPFSFHRYTATLVQQRMTDKHGGLEYYADIDHDGISEHIVCFDNTVGQASLKFMEADDAIIGHCYLHGQMIRQPNALFPVTGDSSRYLIFVYTQSGDSLFLNTIFRKSSEFTAVSRFVALQRMVNGSYDFRLMRPFFEDLDGDGHREFISGIMAGFSLRPRTCLIYDPGHDSLIFAPSTGFNYQISDIRDLDHDGKKELILMTYSIDNYPDSVTGPAGDHSAWLMVLDHRLRYFFPPVEFPGNYIHVDTRPVFTGFRNYLVSLVWYSGAVKAAPYLELADIHGRLVSRKELNGRERVATTALFPLPPDHAGEIGLLKSGGRLEILDTTLSTIREVQLWSAGLSFRMEGDFDHDGRLEYMFVENHSGLPVIFRNDLSDPAILHYPVERDIVHYSLIKDAGNPAQLFIQNGNSCYMFSYSANPQYYLKYPFYAGIYLAILLVILFAQYLQRQLLQQRYAAGKKIAGLQLMLLKKQVDPHFTFNAINTVSSLLMQRRPAEANENLMNLSKLIRSCVEQGDRLSRSLGEELSFISNYLELIHYRMHEGFTYTVDVHPEIDLNVQVPGMVTQIYIENAVRHGLMPLESGGKLDLVVYPEGNLVVIRIEDNGIGRKRAAILGSGGTGKGMAMMEQVYTLFNRYNREKISCEVTDLYHDNRTAAGTRVTIRIPKEFRYNIY